MDGGIWRKGSLADRREPSSPTLGYEIRAQIESKGENNRRKKESRAGRKWVSGEAVGVAGIRKTLCATF